MMLAREGGGGVKADYAGPAQAVSTTQMLYVYPDGM